MTYVLIAIVVLVLIIREDIETSYRKKLNDAYESVQKLVEKGSVSKDMIILQRMTSCGMMTSTNRSSITIIRIR